MTIGLGKYVVTRLRSDGSYGVAFKVPGRLRPKNWPATMPLPLEQQSGDLTNAAECGRIRKDAQLLYAELVRMKQADEGESQSQTWRALIGLYQQSSRFTLLKPTTQRNYTYVLTRVLRYIDAHAYLQPTTIKESDVEEMLSLHNWNNSEDMRHRVWVALRLLMAKAIKKKWRTDDPMRDIASSPRKVKERKALIWEKEDVDRLSEACAQTGYASIADIIFSIWEIGQRLTDVRNFRVGEHYVNGSFRFFQSKAYQYVTIPVPDL